MFNIFFTLVCASLYFSLFIGLFLPLGYLLLPKSFPTKSRYILAFGVSAIVYAALFSLLILGGDILGDTRQVIILSLAGGSLFFFIKEGHWRDLIKSSCLQPTIFVFLFYLLLCFAVCFPDGNLYQANLGVAMNFTRLPGDGFIPYNLSRMLIDNIPLDAKEVAPGWAATDRGPLAAILLALWFSILGVLEKDVWNGQTAPLPFFYHCLICFLNLFSLLALWLIADRLSGKRAAAGACIVLLSSYFFLTNIFYPWPKFFMAYFIIGSALLWFHHKAFILSGLFFAAALLAHDSAIFALASMLTISACIALRTLFAKDKKHALKKQFSAHLQFTLALFSLFGPWLYTKLFLYPSSSRLLHYHLFCDHSEKLELSIGEAFGAYLDKHSIADIISIRLANIWYPFDLSGVYDKFLDFVQAPYSALYVSNGDFFLRYILNIGPLFIPVMLFGLAKCIKDKERPKEILPLVGIGIGSLMFASLISGCENNTVSHIWVYPLLLISGVLCGHAMSGANGVSKALFSIVSGLGLGVAGFFYYFLSPLQPMLHIAPHLTIVKVFILFISFVFLFYLMEKKDITKERETSA